MTSSGTQWGSRLGVVAQPPLLKNSWQGHIHICLCVCDIIRLLAEVLHIFTIVFRFTSTNRIINNEECAHLLLNTILGHLTEHNFAP
jgi:hypothetical protein